MQKVFSIIILCFLIIISTGSYTTTSVSQLPLKTDLNLDTTLSDFEDMNSELSVIINDNDKNGNKLHDSLENNVEYPFPAPVLICYSYLPIEADVDKLEEIGIEVYYKCEYVNVIATGIVTKQDLDLIVLLPGVTLIEPAPKIEPLLDISARAVKARDSQEYSPDTAWELGYTGKGINIAMLDTGVDDDHPSLRGKFIAGVDFAGGTGQVTPKDGRYNPDDDIGHGTSTAGTAMGTGGMDGMYMGIAPDARLIDVRITLGRGGSILAGVEWCLDNINTDWNNNGPDDFDGIDVISISIGGGDDADGSSPTSQLINQLVDAGAVVLVAVGNDGPNNRGISDVAAADKAITVGNLDTQGTVDRSDDEVHTTSSRGPRRDDDDDDLYDELKPDVVAPGVDITAPRFSVVGQRGNGYDSNSGSSLSCPHVSGICALMLEANPALNPLEIKKILHDTAEAMGEPSVPELSDKYNYESGYGSVDAYEAVRVASGFVSKNHRPEIIDINAKPRFVEPEGEVTINVIAKDSDGDTLGYNYTASGGEFSGYGPEVTWTAPDQTGTYEVSAIVDDGQLFSDPMNVTITVETEPTNHPPKIEDIFVNPTMVGPGENSTIIVTASDPDEDELSYDYSASGGSIIGKGAEVSWEAPNIDGTYSISIVVNDGRLDSDKENVFITVEGAGENQPPEIESFSANPINIHTNGIVQLRVQAQDPEEGRLTYSYSATDGKISGTGKNVTWTAPDYSGSQIIDVTVKDEMGLSDSDDLIIEVFQQNFAPVFLEGKANPNKAKSDGKTEVILFVKISDENGLDDISKVTVDLSSIFGSENQRMYDNGKQGDKTKNDGTFTYSYLIPKSQNTGEKKLLVSVQDRYGAQDTGYISINITTAGDSDDKSVIEQYLPLPGFGLEILAVAVIIIALVFGPGRFRSKRKIKLN
jgi:subtilisin family serine protease